ncbi:MAG: cytochrome C biogenesis protein [Gammaproteobacteria bacterium RIFCSPHIGHO2_12_FULL_63_22]|nr:MAG: cytochrome C biogenesis protein [Gammaproteobacteria bacterium RIFCSPHIGHO2_12_FULL_63_22]
MKRLTLAILLALLAAVASAKPIEFQSPSEQTRFRELTEELRCVMCQNQSLADSNAPIAHDLRLEVLRLMRDGKSDAQIKKYLVARYTDFVLYEPEVKPMTWLLWFGPGLLIIGGGIVIAIIVKKRGQRAPDAPPSSDSQEW